MKIIRKIKIKDAFASKAQQGYLFVKKPAVAKEFASKTSKVAYEKLPKKVVKKVDWIVSKIGKLIKEVTQAGKIDMHYAREFQQTPVYEYEELSDYEKLQTAAKTFEPKMKAFLSLLDDADKLYVKALERRGGL